MLMARRADASSEWRQHWTLVLAASVGFAFHSLATYSTGLFIEPLHAEFGWSRAQITGGLTIAALSTIPLSIPVGALIDRWGVRRLALPGIVLTSVAIAAFGSTGSSIFHWLGLWGFYALVGMMVKSTIWTVAVTSAFDSGRSLALALTLCGTAIAQMLAPPYANFLIESFGWRNAYWILALTWGGPALVLCTLFLKDARRRPVAGPAMGKVMPLPGLTLSQALRDPALLRIAAATLIMMMLGIAIIVHFVPILREAGVSRSDAANLAGLSGLAGIVGKLVTGWLMDRWHGRWIGGVTVSSCAIAFALLLDGVRTPSLIILSVLLIGYAVGAKLQVTSYLTSRYAGMRCFGAIFGGMATMLAVGTGVGPVIAGVIYDSSGSYQPLLIAAIPASLVCGLLILSLGPYPDWTVVKAGSDAEPA
ncbi:MULTISPECIES: MFS transporter [unclassified Novosphingobium]|uniref:MFS transporter n=1 Tax=unclassified Novosphingobium TaxID=2644732 RepID=UPI001F32BC50|nr:MULTISPECIES: MFS transporter [unclassified Novosphingobium]